MALVMLSGAMLAGCNGQSKGTVSIPEPISLLLPETVRIHPFTGTRTFNQNGGVNGIDVRIEALDHFGDPTKAFGTFRFELFTYQPRSSDPRGKRLAVWALDVSDPQENLNHWESLSRMYEFRLAWEKPIPVGQRFVLMAVYESLYGPRLFDQRVFVSGE